MIGALGASRGVLEAATRILALIGFAGLVAICLVTMYDGLARYFWLPRVRGFRDFGEVIFAVLIASCFPIGLLRNQNIAVTFLGKALGPRLNAVFNLFAALVTLLGFALIAYALYIRTGGLGMRATRTGFMLVAPWAWAATIIMASAVIVQIWIVLARIVEVVTGEILIDDHAGAMEGGIEEGLSPADVDALSAERDEKRERTRL
jgi:TRAP-type C4-dicarboxylate transport system permease small subunit